MTNRSRAVSCPSDCRTSNKSGKPAKSDPILILRRRVTPLLCKKNTESVSSNKNKITKGNISRNDGTFAGSVKSSRPIRTTIHTIEIRSCFFIPSILLYAKLCTRKILQFLHPAVFFLYVEPRVVNPPKNVIYIALTTLWL